MKLQNVLFPSTDTCTEESMYFRRNQKTFYYWCDDKVDIQAEGVVDFDTYFNGFSAEKWMKYTKVKTVFLKVKVKGCVRLTMMRKEKQGGKILTEYTGEHLCKTQKDEVKEFTFPFMTSSPLGMYCFRLVGVEGVSSFFSASYGCDLAEEEISPVKIGIDICTYKRERFVEKNLELLKSHFLNDPKSVMHDKLEVFISDNAHSLDIKKLSSDKIHIFQNKNVGGAGGFTRGMIEIKKVKDKRRITHILVMDDDILIEPEAIFRTYMLLLCVKDEYRDAFVGGAMLRLDERYVQTESGAVWNGGYLVSLKRGLDLRETDACLFNEFEENTQFNAWWYCAFPVDVVTDDNLPMPIFIRGDDVEYGLRNIKHLILMNGICVWHEPFEFKYSSFLYYYILRNRLIDNALHNMVLPKNEFIKILWTQVMDELRLYRYKNAELLMRGVEDFFKGVKWLAEQDGEKLHKDIMNSGYKLQYLEDMDERYNFFYPMYEKSLHDTPATDIRSRIVNHYTINGTYLKPLKDYAIVPTVGPCMSSVYRTKIVLNYDYASRKGFVTKRDATECKRLIKKLNGLIKRVNAEYDDKNNDFASEAKSLMTLEFWKKYLQI